jgi:hypothetical protein
MGTGIVWKMDQRNTSAFAQFPDFLSQRPCFTVNLFQSATSRTATIRCLSLGLLLPVAALDGVEGLFLEEIPLLL